MDRYVLNLIQLGTLKDTVERQIDFYQRLKSRMQQRQFKTNDPLWIEATVIHKALREFALSLHHTIVEKRRHRW